MEEIIQKVMNAWDWCEKAGVPMHQRREYFRLNLVNELARLPQPADLTEKKDMRNALERIAGVKGVQEAHNIDDARGIATRVLEKYPEPKDKK